MISASAHFEKQMWNQNIVGKRRELASKISEEEEGIIRNKMDLFQPCLAKCFTSSLCGGMVIKTRISAYHEVHLIYMYLLTLTNLSINRMLYYQM